MGLGGSSWRILADRQGGSEGARQALWSPRVKVRMAQAKPPTRKEMWPKARFQWQRPPDGSESN